MHCRLIVAIPGTVYPDEVYAALTNQVDSYAAQVDVEGLVPGKWDWWVVGGRWSGSFTLTSEARSRKRTELRSILSISQAGEPYRSVLPDQTDCARLCDIEPDSLSAPFYWIDQDGRLHEIDDLDERLLEIQTNQFMNWLHALPADTWLINVDVHR